MDEGEIYTRADGKRVRRVKRSNSSSGKDAALAGLDTKNENSNSQRTRRVVRSNSSQGDKGGGDKPVRRIKRSSSSHASSSHSRGGLAGLLGKDDDKSVRRVRRSNSTHSGMAGKAGSLSGFLAKDGNESKPKISGSRSVGYSEGEVYTRADGKKGE
jgi:hypothetical protein